MTHSPRGLIFRFNDTEEEVGVVVRRGVCILAPTLEKPDITVQVGSCYEYEWTDLSSDDYKEDKIWNYEDCNDDNNKDKIVIELQVSSQVWREVLAKQRTALAASLTGEIRSLLSLLADSDGWSYVADVHADLCIQGWTWHPGSCLFLPVFWHRAGVASRLWTFRQPIYFILNRSSLHFNSIVSNGCLLSSLVIDTLRHIHDHPVKSFRHAHLGRVN